jgi:hypothetical protein
MRADRVLELRVSRAMIEVLDIASGEIELFWDVRPDQARRFAKALRVDLVSLESDEFLDKWTRWQQD